MTFFNYQCHRTSSRSMLRAVFRGKKMFNGVGIPEIVTGLLIGVATVGIVLFWRNGGRRMM
jgi:hypothetical protein